MAIIPERHILVCTGSDCKKQGGKKLCKALKEALAERKMKRDARVVEVDCLQQCGHGPIAIVYPDAVWYAGLPAEEAEQVIDQHLTAGKPLSNRLYRKAHGPHK